MTVTEFENIVQTHKYNVFVDLFFIRTFKRESEIVKVSNMMWYKPPVDGHAYVTQYERFSEIAGKEYCEFVVALESNFSKN
jgi:hypothetical protein